MSKDAPAAVNEPELPTVLIPTLQPVAVVQPPVPKKSVPRMTPELAGNRTGMPTIVVKPVGMAVESEMTAHALDPVLLLM
jgi:hypothetical protein